ncbi:hypothetical protein [Desulfovibrio sp. DV]|uniref:hypothetical protein n=1 Tax=Desulfovibrio sp. DV TaxID=1844708 RepID=UPI00094BAC62|nr:hypothetical protein [Desulfovibrio sp. DV]
MTPETTPFTPIAWNGIRLTVPASWRPTRLGLGYLLFEDGSGPAFELKWRRNAGREGMEAAFRAMTPKGRARRAEALPEAWTRQLSDFESMPITWTTGEHAGCGAALFCPDCGLAALFQGYGGAQGPSPGRVAEIAAVLGSLAHHEPGPPAFALYGLAYVPPPDYLLAAFQFVPGRFSLTFANGRRRLDIVRLAPAEVLLAGHDLGWLAAQAFGFEADADTTSAPLGESPAVWLAERQGPNWAARIARALGRPARLAVLRHDTAAGKLLGAAAAGPKPIDAGWLAETAGRCVSL